MERPPEPPKLPEDPPEMPPIQMIKDGGGGIALLPVAFIILMGVVTISMCGCTTSFDTDRDIEVDTELDTTDVAESPDLSPDSLEVPDVVEDDGGGVSDTEGDTDEDTEDPCVYYPMWFRDQDMDGWGRDDLTVCFPTQPEGYVASGGDCCDVRPEVHPGVEEWQEEPYTCPDESWDYDCDGDEEPRWPGASWDRCTPHCATDCGSIDNEVDCVASVWWDGGGTGVCGAEEGVGTPRCQWNALASSCSGGYMVEGQQCR